MSAGLSEGAVVPVSDQGPTAVHEGLFVPEDQHPPAHDQGGVQREAFKTLGCQAPAARRQRHAHRGCCRNDHHRDQGPRDHAAGGACSGTLISMVRCIVLLQEIESHFTPHVSRVAFLGQSHLRHFKGWPASVTCALERVPLGRGVTLFTDPERPTAAGTSAPTGVLSSRRVLLSRKPWSHDGAPPIPGSLAINLSSVLSIGRATGLRMMSQRPASSTCGRRPKLRA